MRGVLDELLSREEETALVENARKGQMSARTRILRRGLQLTAAMADHYVEKGVVREDLVSEGMKRFFYCLEKFDPCEGTSFFRYVAWWMKYGMSNLVKHKEAYCCN